MGGGRQLNIPTEFALMGKTYKVKVNDNTGMDYNGYYNPQTLEISIAKGQPIDLAEHVFYHELVHCILQTMNEKQLYEDEKFTDIFGGLLHQALNTAKGKLNLGGGGSLGKEKGR